MRLTLLGPALCAGVLCLVSFLLILSSSGCGGGPETSTTSNTSASTTETDASGNTNAYRPFVRPPDPDQPAANANTGNRASNTPAPSVDPATNDQKVKAEIDAAQREFDKGQYEAALKRLNQAETLRPRQGQHDAALNSLRHRIETFWTAFKGVGVLKPSDKLVQVVLTGGVTETGYVLERDDRKRLLLIRTPLNSYMRISLNEVEDEKPVPPEKQKEQIQQQYERAKYAFEQRPNPTPAEMFKFAQTAWRYGQSQEAHKRLSEAFARDADIADTVRMESDPLYVKFQTVTARGDSMSARELLRQLSAKYPRATLFKDVAAQMAQSASNTNAPTSNAAANVNANVGNAPGATAAAPIQLTREMEQRILASIDEQAKVAATQAKQDTKLNASATLMGDLPTTAAGLEQRADEYARKGEEFDAKSLPGMPNEEENLDKAIFNYRCAQELYAKAVERGGSPAIADKQVNVNKALYWCRKRSKH